MIAILPPKTEWRRLWRGGAHLRSVASILPKEFLQLDLEHQRGPRKVSIFNVSNGSVSTVQVVQSSRTTARWTTKGDNTYGASYYFTVSQRSKLRTRTTLMKEFVRVVETALERKTRARSAFESVTVTANSRDDLSCRAIRSPIRPSFVHHFLQLTANTIPRVVLIDHYL